MKKLFVLLLMIAMVFTFAACGGGEKEPAGTEGGQTSQGGDAPDDGELQGYTGGDGSDLANVTDGNYADIAKNLFGLELKDVSGWTYKEAKSPNGVNNLIVSYTVSGGEDAKEVMSGYFDQCKAVAEGGVCSQGFNADYTAVVKGDPAPDFDTIFTEGGSYIGDYYNIMWLYDFGGKEIQFSLSIDVDYAELTLSLLG